MEQDGALIGQEGGEEDKEKMSMQTLLEEGLSLDLPNQGEIRQGTIATIRENEILVSIGTKSEGVISGRELEQIPDDERKNLKIGQPIPVFVIAPEDPNGNVVLSYVRAREENDWGDVEAMLESNEPRDSKIIGFNKGGLIVPVGSLRGFVPASQISLTRRPGWWGNSGTTIR
jgi:small subunit ribosomal protein S1